MLERGDEYFAGLFDGEGTVGIYPIGPYERICWSCRLSIVGTFRPQIEAAYLHFGLGSLSTQKRQALQRLPKGLSIDPKLCKQSWRWLIQRKEEVLNVLERVYPYLMEKREQAEVVMKFCKGELDGETASKMCKEAKQFEFPAFTGESPRKSTGSPAEWNPASKLSYEKAQEIRRLVAEGMKQAEAAKSYKVSKHIISRIINNLTYTRPPMSYSKGDNSGPKLLAPPEKTAGSGIAKLTWDQADEIRQRVRDGEKQIDLAREFKVSKVQISRVVNNLTYVRPGSEVIEPIKGHAGSAVAKLTYEEADVIRQRVKNGEKPITIAKELGVTKEMIYNLVKNKTYIRSPQETGKVCGQRI
jgi:DNA invertase Pin-like site-specific DNA recombinase